LSALALPSPASTAEALSRFASHRRFRVAAPAALALLALPLAATASPLRTARFLLLSPRLASALVRSSPSIAARIWWLALVRRWAPSLAPTRRRRPISLWRPRSSRRLVFPSSVAPSPPCPRAWRCRLSLLLRGGRRNWTRPHCPARDAAPPRAAAVRLR